MIWPPSPIEPAASPVKVKLPAAPSGTVCFSTMIVPRFVLVKVQVTVSPGATLNVAVRAPTEPVELASSQTTDVRSQPSFAASVETY